MGKLTRLETRLYLYAYLGYALNPADSTFSALLMKINALQSEEARYAAVLESEFYSLRWKRASSSLTIRCLNHSPTHFEKAWTPNMSL